MSIQDFLYENQEEYPETRQVSVRLTVEQIGRIDNYASNFEVSRSSVISNAVDDWLETADSFMADIEVKK